MPETFRLLLRNPRTGRFQRPQPCLRFSDWYKNQDGRPGMVLYKIRRNLTGSNSKTLTSSTEFVCIFFRVDKKTKMVVLASDWRRHIFDFFSILQPLKIFKRNLIGSKTLTSSTNLVFFRSFAKTRWSPWTQICWDNFDLFSATAEQKSTKLDKKQELNVLYQVCVRVFVLFCFVFLFFFFFCFFSAPEPKAQVHYCDHALSVCLSVVNFSHFRLLLWNSWTEFNETWQEVRSQRPLPSLCFSGPIGRTRWLPWPLIGWDIFDFSSETTERNSTKLNRKQDLNILYQVCVFRADWKNKVAAMASDWLRHFQLLLLNRWTEFNETWQEARSQRPLPSLCFSGRSEKQDGRPGLWLAETFSTSSLKPPKGIQRN